jgi:hypothetical protein
MAHLKNGHVTNQETVYKPHRDQRFAVLTNGLEEAHCDTQTLFSSWMRW